MAHLMSPADLDPQEALSLVQPGTLSPSFLALRAVLALASSWVACGPGAVPGWRREAALSVSIPGTEGSWRCRGNTGPESPVSEAPG